jgi:hypothetical protein
VKQLYTFGYLLLGAALAALFFAFNPEQSELFPKCPFHALTGFDCPGCGSQRAIHSLLHGNFAAAIDYNLLLVFAMPVLLTHFGYVAYNTITGNTASFKILHMAATPKIVFALILLFWILRNVPAAPFNYLAA